MSEPNAIPRDIAALLQPDDYGLAFAPRYNRNRMIDGDPARREEVHDADYFRGSAERFCEFHGESRYTVHVIDNGRNPQTQEGDANSNAARRQQILDILDDYDGPMLRVVGIFCHGYRDGIQLGFSIRNANERGATDQLLDLLAQKCRPDLIVPIYACSTGSSGRNEEGGEGGFADYIRDGLCQRGITNCRVDGHTEVADAMACPHVRRFEGGGSAGGGEGGQWLVDPNSDIFQAWRQALRDTNMKYRYPMMRPSAIRAELIVAQYAE